MLRSQGHDVLWARTHCPGASDAAILDLAESDARVVLTLDNDFRQLAIQRRTPLEQSGVVLFRTHPATADRLVPLVSGFLRAERPWKRHVSIVSNTDIQMIAARKR